MNVKDIRGHARPTTAERYTLFLKSALIKINKEPQFNGLEFCKKNKITCNFFKTLVALKYVDSVKSGGTRYIALTHPGTVTEADGKRIAEYNLAYNYNHSTFLPKYVDSDEAAKKQKELIETARPHLHLFTDQELIRELLRRGYTEQ